MNRRPPDPRRVNVSIDANALDHGGGHDAEVKRLLALRASGEVNLIAPGGVILEAHHPHTPPSVQENVATQIFSLPVKLNEAERSKFACIRRILQGNAAPGRHDADARHVFEAAKYGGYFITHDRRINKTKRQELEAGLLSLWIVTPAEFLAIYDCYESERPV